MDRQISVASVARVVGLACSLVAAFFGCRPYHMYEGEFQPDSNVGTITQTYAIRMMTIDGGDTGISHTFKLLPGRHTLDAELYQVGAIGEVDPRTTRSVHRSQGQTRRYIGRCRLALDVTGGGAWVIDGGKLADDRWAIWAVQPKPLHPEQSWAAVEQLNPPHCICGETK